MATTQPKVAGLILRIVRAPAPKLRYSAGHDGRWIPHLKTLIPQRTFDRLLRRSLYLPNPTTTKTCQTLTHDTPSYRQLSMS